MEYPTPCPNSYAAQYHNGTAWVTVKCYKRIKAARGRVLKLASKHGFDRVRIV